jgi:HSP20 family protein
MYRSEFRYGSFVRNIRLPEGTKDEDITATYKDGILEIRVPLPEQAEKETVTRVPITHG